MSPDFWTNLSNSLRSFFARMVHAIGLGGSLIMLLLLLAALLAIVAVRVRAHKRLSWGAGIAAGVSLVTVFIFAGVVFQGRQGNLDSIRLLPGYKLVRDGEPSVIWIRKDNGTRAGISILLRPSRRMEPPKSDHGSWGGEYRVRGRRIWMRGGKREFMGLGRTFEIRFPDQDVEFSTCVRSDVEISETIAMALSYEPVFPW